MVGKNEPFHILKDAENSVYVDAIEKRTGKASDDTDQPPSAEDQPSAAVAMDTQ